MIFTLMSNFHDIFFNTTMYSISVGLLSAFCVYILFTKDMLVFRIFIYDISSFLFSLKTLQREFPWSLKHRFLWGHHLLEVGMLEFRKLALLLRPSLSSTKLFLTLKSISGALLKLL